MKTIQASLPSGTTNPSPDIHGYVPTENQNGQALVIFAGGGYYQRVEHEGKGYAEYFSKKGITCFVVDYRLGSSGHRHPAMLEDALAAIFTIRSRADEFGIDPNQIGLIGSSAGGHLVASALIHWDKYKSDISLRPNFGILCYPVIMSQGPHINQGTFINLLGDTPEQDTLDFLDCPQHVTSDTPPCFLWSTGEDSVVPVENTLNFAAALSRNRVPYDLHIYHKGSHGLGLDTPYKWEDQCLKWLKQFCVDS